MAHHKNGDNISEELEIKYNKKYILSREENVIWKRNLWPKVCGGGIGGGGDDDDDNGDGDGDDAYSYDDINGEDSKLLETKILLKYIDRRGKAMK